jgi:hypothetical protein
MEQYLALRWRVLCWAVAGAGGLIATVLLIGGFRDAAAISSLRMLLPFFPAGLFFFTDLGTSSVWLGWAVYTGISVMLLRTRNTQRYLWLLAMFCVMLSVNAYGCGFKSGHLNLNEMH